jgi:hypothetical protein
MSPIGFFLTTAMAYSSQIFTSTLPNLDARATREIMPPLFVVYRGPVQGAWKD